MEGHSSRLEKDRISEFKDKIKIKENTEELLVKQLKTCERNMQELIDTIKRPNLTIMGMEEEEVEAKKICNILNKIITENILNLEKIYPFRYR
jgi:esterase/lipase